jgi:hypothetical protein
MHHFNTGYPLLQAKKRHQGASGRIWTPPPTCAVAAGILPAVEPGILPGGIAVPQARGAPPGGRMPPSTAGKMPAATWGGCPDAPGASARAVSGMRCSRASQTGLFELGLQRAHTEAVNLELDAVAVGSTTGARWVTSQCSGEDRLRDGTPGIGWLTLKVQRLPHSVHFAPAQKRCFSPRISTRFVHRHECQTLARLRGCVGKRAFAETFSHRPCLCQDVAAMARLKCVSYL